jgi:transposase
VLILPRSVRVYLAAELVDLRRGHDGLCALVQGVLGGDPYAGHLFVFLGKRLDRCKVLFWERGGFVVYYKRLEQGRFRQPKKSADGAAMEMDAAELVMLLDGINVREVKRPVMWEPKKKLTL